MCVLIDIKFIQHFKSAITFHAVRTVNCLCFMY